METNKTHVRKRRKKNRKQRKYIEGIKLRTGTIMEKNNNNKTRGKEKERKARMSIGMKTKYESFLSNNSAASIYQR